MMNPTTQAGAARLAGAMFLFVNLAGTFSHVIVGGSLLSGDVHQVAQNIVQSERLYRLGITGDLASFTGGLVLIWALYVLLRPVNRDLALLALMLRLVETAVSVAATVASLTAVHLLSGTQYLNAFTPDELDVMSRMARLAFGFGEDIGFIFLGLGSAMFAYLLLRSLYVPRILAGWGLFASLLFAAYNLVIVVLPSTTMFQDVSLAPMGIYEISIGLWLVIKGAKIQRSSTSAT